MTKQKTIIKRWHALDIGDQILEVELANDNTARARNSTGDDQFDTWLDLRSTMWLPSFIKAINEVPPDEDLTKIEIDKSIRWKDLI